MGHTLSAAVAATPNSSGWMICLGDMPLIQTTTYLEILHKLTPDSIVRPQYRGINGHPVAFGQTFFDELIKLEGDQGGKQILRKYASHLVTLDTEDAGVVTDIDTREDLDQLQRSHR